MNPMYGTTDQHQHLWSDYESRLPLLSDRPIEPNRWTKEDSLEAEEEAGLEDGRRVISEEGRAQRPSIFVHHMSAT